MNKILELPLLTQSCNRHEQHLLRFLRALVGGSQWKSQADEELDCLGIGPDSAGVFLRLMAHIKAMGSRFKVLDPDSALVSVDELALLRALRRAAIKAARSTLEEVNNLDMGMPRAVVELVSYCGEVLSGSIMRLSSRPFLIDAARLDAQSDTDAANGLDYTHLRRRAMVLSVEALTTHTCCIRLKGPELAGLCNEPPAQWVKIFPVVKRSETFVESGDSIRQDARTFAVHAFDPEHAILTIHVSTACRHPVSLWLASAEPGYVCEMAVSRGGFDGVPADCRRVTLAGDETALPAIAAILDILPASLNAQAFIEIDESSQLASLPRIDLTKVHWVTRNTNPSAERPLTRAVLGWCAHDPDMYVWAAGEAAEMRDLRIALRSAPEFAPHHVRTIAYWTRG